MIAVNTMLPYEKCEKMVNRIADPVPAEQEMRCLIAQKWLNENKVITEDEYIRLMDRVYVLRTDAEHRIIGRF